MCASIYLSISFSVINTSAVSLVLSLSLSLFLSLPFWALSLYISISLVPQDHSRTFEDHLKTVPRDSEIPRPPQTAPRPPTIVPGTLQDLPKTAPRAI